MFSRILCWIFYIKLDSTHTYYLFSVVFLSFFVLCCSLFAKFLSLFCAFWSLKRWSKDYCKYRSELPSSCFISFISFWREAKLIYEISKLLFLFSSRAATLLYKLLTIDRISTVNLLNFSVTPLSYFLISITYKDEFMG